MCRWSAHLVPYQHRQDSFLSTPVQRQGRWMVKEAFAVESRQARLADARSDILESWVPPCRQEQPPQDGCREEGKTDKSNSPLAIVPRSGSDVELVALGHALWVGTSGLPHVNISVRDAKISVFKQPSSPCELESPGVCSAVFDSRGTKIQQSAVPFLSPAGSCIHESRRQCLPPRCSALTDGLSIRQQGTQDQGLFRRKLKDARKQSQGVANCPWDGPSGAVSGPSRRRTTGFRSHANLISEFARAAASIRHAAAQTRVEVKPHACRWRVAPGKEHVDGAAVMSVPRRRLSTGRPAGMSVAVRSHSKFVLTAGDRWPARKHRRRPCSLRAPLICALLGCNVSNTQFLSILDQDRAPDCRTASRRSFLWRPATDNGSVGRRLLSDCRSGWAL